MRRSVTLVAALVIIAAPAAYERTFARLPQDLPSFLASRSLVRTVTQSESRVVADASSFVEVGRMLGLGTCAGQGNENSRLHALQFLDEPARACGQGRLGILCQQAFDNCVATENAIACDQDYLARLGLLARIVLSADPSKAVPSDGLARIARFALAARQQPAQSASRYLANNPQVRELTARYSWQDVGLAANLDWNTATAALGGAVVLHELSHVEQKACALTHDDPRFVSSSEILETLGCRILPKNETRADMRALDISAVAATSFEKFHKDAQAARALYVRALVARLEYEAMVLTDPARAIRMYSEEPRDPGALWTYYYNAGARDAGTSSADHIPPELRPVAALSLLTSRGFLRRDEQTLAFKQSERLRPYLTGILWKTCDGKRAPEAIRDALDSLMFDIDPLQSQAKPAPAVQPQPLQRSFEFGREMAVVLGALINDNKEMVGPAYKRAAAAARQVEFDMPVPPLNASSAEGLKFIISTAPSVETALTARYDKRTAAAFSFPFSVLAANLFAADAKIRETFLSRAAAAASFLGVDQDSVAQIFRYVEKNDLKGILAALDAMQQKLR